MYSQACFDDLVSRSHDGVHQAHDEQGISVGHLPSDISNQQKSPHHDTSIDELLETYRPTQNSILECITSIDDSSLVTTKKIDLHNTIFLESASISAGKNQDPVDSTSYAAEPGQKCCKKRQNTHDAANEPSCLDQMNATSCGRQRRRSMSLQEKEERRRAQNREAQRRYRERNMLSPPCEIPGRPIFYSNGSAFLFH